MKGAIELILLAGMAVVCAPAQAQTLYKCGNVYQDRPCEAGKTGRAIGSAATAAPAAKPGAADAECAQRGRDSLKVVWSREGGASEERLLSEAATLAQRRFIQDVYRRRGAASQVQAAVAADCVAEKEQLERDAALAAAEALRAQREGRQPASASALQAPAQPAPDPEAEARLRRQQEAAEAERKRALCARYNADMDDQRARERTGGSARTMDRLAESRRQLQERMSRSGC